MSEKIYPYSDDAMTYSEKWHRYVLTPQAVRDHLGVDLETRLNTRGAVDRAAVAPAFLNSVSRELYAYIYSCGVQNAMQEFLAAKHPAARDILFEAMLEQVNYTLLNGDITKLSGVDIRKGTVMDRKALVVAQIDPVAIEILSRPLDAVTPCLIYNGASFMFYRPIKLPAYEAEGY